MKGRKFAILPRGRWALLRAAVEDGSAADRLKFAASVLRHRDALSPLLKATQGSLLARTLASHPQILQFGRAPYLNASWDAQTRISRFIHHISVLESLGPRFSFDPTHSVEVMNLPEIGPDYHVILDKPTWFHREGVLTLNLFKNNTRIFSIAFAIEVLGGETTILIGGVQGRNLPNILDEYRELTRLSFGIRPRDLIIEILRMFAQSIGANAMIAISDACRHHRSHYFSPDVNRSLPLNYDEIWNDRGGAPNGGGFYSLPMKRQTRASEEIPAKKRAMYRRRYELLDIFEERMMVRSTDLRPSVRPEAK